MLGITNNLSTPFLCGLAQSAQHGNSAKQNLSTRADKNFPLGNLFVPQQKVGCG